MATRLVALLRAMGHAATSTRDAQRLDADDGPQLEYAAAHGWTLITHNMRDYRRLHEQWLAQGRTHPGIVTFDRPRGQTADDIAQRLAELLSRPHLELRNTFWRWHGNNQWRQYPHDKG